MRKPTLDHARKLDPEQLSRLPASLAGDPELVIRQLAGDLLDPWRMWVRPTELRGRLGSLSPADEELLHRSGVLRPLDGSPTPASPSVAEIEAVLQRLVCPDLASAIRPQLLDSFSLEPSDLATTLHALHAISPETARTLLTGRVATARDTWARLGGEQQAKLELPFTEVVADLLPYHLLDLLWQAGADAGRRRFRLTGSALVDGDGRSEAKLGGIAGACARWASPSTCSTASSASGPRQAAGGGHDGVRARLAVGA